MNSTFLKKTRHASGWRSSEGWHPGNTFVDSSLRWNDDRMMDI